MNTTLNLSKKSFAIYGLGTTGKSVIDYFKKLGFKNYTMWDDNKILQNSWRLNKKKEKDFLELIDFVDYIVISPGINIRKTKLKKILAKHKHKMITDLDLFYMLNPRIKSVVVTGTNGKSTTCKIIEHVLKKNKINTALGGNIGRPVLSLSLKKNPLTIIEASSFQLAYSKFVKPDYALILNITKDHLDWHGSMNNYIQSKLKIFSLQKKNNFAFVNNKNLLKKFKEKRYQGNLKFIKSKDYKKIKKRIKNNYLNSEANQENMSFVYVLSKIFKISDNDFVKALKSFKGLEHRHEIFYRKQNIIFINDSKATTFQASKFALKSNENIFWIVGGLPKLGDCFKLGKLKKNIIKSYVVGKNMKYFKNQLKGKIDFKLSSTLNNAIVSIFKDIKNIKKNKTITILLSPASASYDQYNNFEERGKLFKRLTKSYARKFF